MSDSQHDYYILYEQAQQEIEKLVSDSVKKFREKNVEIEKLKAEKTKQEMQIAGLIKHGAIQHERITKLTRQRDTLKKCAEFYADKNNWLREKDGWRHDMIVKDLDDESLTDWEKRFSGKTARKALQDVEENENEKSKL